MDLILRSTKEKPGWCLHKRCKILRTFQNAMCVGKLSKPAKHGNDFNTHRFCLRGVLKDNAIFDLQINKTDVYWFGLLFKEVKQHE